MISSLRTGLAGLCCAALLSGCGGLDFFGSDEVRLPGERIPVRQARADADVMASAIAVRLPPPVTNADWPQFNGNATRSIGHVAASGTLQQAWRADVGSGSNGRIVSPPIVAGGRVYAMDTGATVSALDAATGARIWSVDLTPETENTRDGFGGGLAADGGRIFATSGFGSLTALDAASGAVAWTGALRAPSRAAPSVAGGRVFAVTRENRLFAFDGTTGAAGWNRQGLEQTAGVLGGAGPAATDRIVVAPYSSGELTAYLTSSGRPVWEEDLTGIRGSGGIAALNDVAGDPVIADGVVYAASQSGRLAAIGLRDGDRLWTRNIGGAQAPYVAGNAVFFVDETGSLHALDRETGDTAWRTDLGGFQDPEDREGAIVWAGPVAAGGRLLLTSSTGRLVSIDPATGQVAAEVRLPDGSSVPPVVAGGTIYVLTDDATLVAFR